MSLDILPCLLTEMSLEVASLYLAITPQPFGPQEASGGFSKPREELSQVERGRAGLPFLACGGGGRLLSP